MRKGVIQIKPMRHFYLLLVLPILSCQGQIQSEQIKDSIPINSTKKNELTEYYANNKGTESPSESVGTVSQGSLKNGKLIPFEGKNYHYFDTSSYLGGRAFVHEDLKKTIVNSYKELEYLRPNQKYCLMECSNKEGGKIHPHRTHQNGLSVDFMSPLELAEKPYYGLDSLGTSHYLLDFDENGKYTKDAEISIDFEALAQHIWTVEQHARKNGLKINKVIFKMELKDELYATEYGQKLKSSSIYITKNLSPLINSLHDDHYHVDFEKIQ